MKMPKSQINVWNEVKEVHDVMDSVRVGVARIEEQLRNLNGSVGRHESDIKNLRDELNKEKLKLAKLITLATGTGTIIGLVTNFVLGKLI